MMLGKPKHKILLGIIFLAAVLALPNPLAPPIKAELYLQSVPVIPAPPPNPNYIESASGGRIYCGSQNSTWLDIPSGFTSEDGAEFHCDPTDSLLQWIGTSDAWDDKGYLIGFWPTTTPIIKPFNLVLKMDPAKASNVCNDCLTTRYYDGAKGQWSSLPITYDVANSVAYVPITEYLPACEYPGYRDRFLIALFVQGTEPTATPTAIRSLTTSPTPTPTSVPAFTPTLTFSPSPTPTLFLSATPTMTATPTSDTSSESPPTSTVTVLLTALVFLMGIVILLLVVVVIFLSRRQGGPQ